MIKNISILILIIYFLIFSRICYISYKRYNNEIVGGDLLQLSDNYEGYFVVVYTFNKNISNKFYNKIKNKLLNFMLENPNDRIFLKINHKSKKYEYRDLSDKKSRINLVNKMLSKKKISKKWGNWDIGDLPIKFYIYENKISILCNHVFIDGYTLFSKYFIVFICDETERINVKIPKYRYIPLLTEYNLFKSFIYINRLSDRNLNLMSWNTRKSSKSIISKIDVNYIKSLKKKYQNSFNSTLASIYLKNMFKSIRKGIDLLNVCFIYCLENVTNFNNFGIISFEIKRSNDLGELSNQLENGFKNYKSGLYSSYVLTNILGIDSNFYDKIDCVFSFIPATKGEFKSGDYKLVDAILKFPYTTAPIYIYSSSFSGYENVTINVNSNDVDKDILIKELKNISDHVVLSEDYLKN